MELNRRMGAATWLAHTAYEYARLLLAPRRRRRERAAALLGEAAELAERIGMAALLARINALGADDAGADPARRPLAARGRGAAAWSRAGLSNREIGAALFISEHTAANHIRSILRKTECANRTEAASYAHRHGLVRGWRERGARIGTMPLYMIERTFAEQLEISPATTSTRSRRSTRTRASAGSSRS